MSWDDDDFEAPPPVTPALGNWDDEDAPKPHASWDEDDTPQAKKAPPPDKKNIKPPASKKPAAAPAVAIKEEILDPLEEKLRKQKLVEESDYQNTKDIFSGIGDKRNEKDEEVDINTFHPSSEAEFERLAAAVAKKLTTLEGSGLYASFLKSLVRQICTPLRVEDCKDISAALNVVVNDKLKAEKEKTKPKKKGGGATSGKKTNVKEAFDYDGGAYDDGDDDFM